MVNGFLKYYYPSILSIELTFELLTMFTSSFKKLKEVTYRLDEHNLQYLSILNRSTNTDPVYVLDAIAVQRLKLHYYLKTRGFGFKISVEQLADQIYVNYRYLMWSSTVRVTALSCTDAAI